MTRLGFEKKTTVNSAALLKICRTGEKSRNDCGCSMCMRRFSAKQPRSDKHKNHRRGLLAKP